MAQVRVWNDNTYPFEQKFKGLTIKIPPKKFCMMENDEADLFLGDYFPPQFDGNEQQTPQSYKMLRIERVSAAESDRYHQTAMLKCNACGYDAPNKSDLDEHTAANHAHQLVVDEEAEIAMKARGRGRPPKSKEVEA